MWRMLREMLKTCFNYTVDVKAYLIVKFGIFQDTVFVSALRHGEPHSISIKDYFILSF